MLSREASEESVLQHRESMNARGYGVISAGFVFR